MILLIFSFIGIIFIGIGFYMKMMDPVIIETKGYIDKVSYEKTNDPDKYEMIYLYSFKTDSGVKINGSYNDSKAQKETISLTQYNNMKNSILSSETGPSRELDIWYFKNKPQTHTVNVPIPGTKNPYTNLLFISGGVWITLGLFISLLTGGSNPRPPIHYMEPYSGYNY